MRERPDGVVEVSLAPEPESVRVARGYVHQRWSDLDEQVLSDAALIVTELVTNAVRHGEPEILLRLRREPFAIDIAVLDHSPVLPATAIEPPDPDNPSGRGLTIVAALSANWGVAPLDEGPGKTVWATVASED